LWLSVLLSFLFFVWFFIALRFLPSFSSLFCLYFLAHVVSSLGLVVVVNLETYLTCQITIIANQSVIYSLSKI
jgi:hypothetical protein